MKNARIDSQGRVLAWGRCDFTNELQAGESQVDISGQKIPSATVDQLIVVGGVIRVMDAGEQAAADAERAAARVARLEGALRIARTLANKASLPLPPPAPNLVVKVVDADGLGTPGIAISTPNKWGVIYVDDVVQ
ncbi:MAG: hypothetical protein ACWGPR_08485 [Candidatus Deferrimicrobiaceae bacterium]